MLLLKNSQYRFRIGPVGNSRLSYFYPKCHSLSRCVSLNYCARPGGTHRDPVLFQSQLGQVLRIEQSICLQ